MLLEISVNDNDNSVTVSNLVARWLSVRAYGTKKSSLLLQRFFSLRIGRVLDVMTTASVERGTVSFKLTFRGL